MFGRRDSVTILRLPLMSFTVVIVGWKALTPFCVIYSYAAFSLPYVQRSAYQLGMSFLGMALFGGGVFGGTFRVDTPVCELSAIVALRVSGRTLEASPAHGGQLSLSPLMCTCVGVHPSIFM